MKLSKILVAVLLVFFTTNGISQDFSEAKLAIDHLKVVNDHWEGKEAFVPHELISFNSDEDRIEYHLKHVVAYLSQAGPGDWDEEISRNRSDLIASLEVYAEAKSFPRNTHHAERTPYFIDDFGTHCAVGQLMKNSGCGDLAKEINSEFNFNYLKDIHNPKIQDWADEFGFTFDELAWIQPDYGPEKKHCPVDGGVNGEVYGLASTIWEGKERVYFYGDFDIMKSELNTGVFDLENGSISCEGLGYIEDYQLHCEESVDGQIVGLEAKDGVIELAGSLILEGVSYQMAAKENLVWTYTNVPGREAYEVKHYYRNWELDQKYLVLDNGVDDQEVWVQEKNYDWVLLAEIQGDILSSFFDGGLYLAGEVTAVKNSYSESTEYYPCSVVQLAYCQPFGMNAQYFDSDNFPETINSINKLNNEIYFGGESISMNDNIYLAKINNGIVLPVLLYSDLEVYMVNEVFTINSVFPSNSGNLIIAGDWYLFFGFYYSVSAMEIDFEGELVDEFAFFNGSVNTIGKYQDYYVLAGDFDSSRDYLNDVSNPNLSIDWCLDSSICGLGGVESFEIIHACEGNSVVVNEEVFTEEGIHEQVLSGQFGCDSIHQVIIIHHQPGPSTTDSKLTCAGDSISLNDFYYSETGQFDIIYEDQFGCDSLVTTNINVVECELAGCTHPVADNYSPFAVEDDGSCLFENLSVCGLGTIWDEDLQTCVCDNCAGDFDGDNLINASDLLVFLAAFGQECSP